MWLFFEGLGMENIGTFYILPLGIFYSHLVYFMVIWHILWPFGIFYGHLVYFSHFGMCTKILQPLIETNQLNQKKIESFFLQFPIFLHLMVQSPGANLIVHFKLKKTFFCPNTSFCQFLYRKVEPNVTALARTPS
jgi:hypothetical protein